MGYLALRPGLYQDVSCLHIMFSQRWPHPTLLPVYMYSYSDLTGMLRKIQPVQLYPRICKRPMRPLVEARREVTSMLMRTRSCGSAYPTGQGTVSTYRLIQVV